MVQSNTLMHKIMVLLSFVTLTMLNAQSETIMLWPNGVPDAISVSNYEEQITYDALNRVRGLSQITQPDLTVFLADKNIANGTAVIICPGGGYTHLAINKEGYKVAKWLNTLGISAFVLKYRMPSDKTMKNKSIGPLQDVQESIRLVRRNASKWNLKRNKIGVLGFSAGGHLAATSATLYNKKVYTSDAVSARPDFSILVYPVISMEQGLTHKGSKNSLLGENASQELINKFSNEKQVNSETPPTFLIHATDDGAVPVKNSVNYYMALKEHNVPAEMHLYENGGHGFGLGRSSTNKYWPVDCENWMRANSLLPDDEVFLFSYFKGNGEDGLHFAYSEDGFSWEALKDGNSFLSPKVGKDKLMRDPCIIKGGEGNYHMVWTVSWTDKGIGYATSKDLIHWSEQQFIPVMAHEEGTRNTWAPELTYEASSNTYMIYWASTITGRFPETQSDSDKGYNHRMYYTTTKDFTSFTNTKLLYEPGFNVIDATIKKQDDMYIMFLKDETREPAEKNLKLAYSETLTGPYSEATAPITGEYWAEGPTAIKVNGNWLVYFDKYIDKKYGAISSSDLKNWKDISEEVNFPEGTRHGTVFKVSRNIFNKLSQE